MKYKDFREFKIERTCNKKLKRYKSYKKYLRKDFHERCAYCNTWEHMIEPLKFSIDHYVPRKVFKNIDKTLDNNYNNLMYVCPKCNREKSAKYEGNIHNLEIKNNLFLNPVEEDYNEIFFRNEYGGIDSNNEKGRKMINELKLYRPLYNIVWLAEQVFTVRKKLKKKIKDENISIVSKDKLKEALLKVDEYYIYLCELLKKCYENK